MIYAAKRHERALEAHNLAWNRMHRIGFTRGRDNDDYRQARQDMLDAHRWMQFVARLPKRKRRRR